MPMMKKAKMKKAKMKKAFMKKARMKAAMMGGGGGGTTFFVVSWAKINMQKKIQGHCQCLPMVKANKVVTTQGGKFRSKGFSSVQECQQFMKANPHVCPVF